jgi:hypothetical protein
MFYRATTGANDNEMAVVTGFNLGGGCTTAATITLPGMGGTAADAVGAPGNYGITNNSPSRYRQFSLTSNAATGDGVVTYSVTGGGTTRQAVNTGPDRLRDTTPVVRPRYIQPWNVEYSPGTNGSELWDDFTQVHIWQSDENIGGADRGRFARGVKVFDPSMSINPRDGVLWESHNEGGGGGGNTGTTKVSSNDGKEWNTDGGNSPYRVAQFIDPITNSDVYISVNSFNGQNSSVWAAYSVIGKPGGDNNDSWNSFGGIWISGPGGSAYRLNQDRDPVNNSTYATSYKYHGESAWYNASISGNNRADPPSTAQFKNPHIITHLENNNKHIHVSYYDSAHTLTRENGVTGSYQIAGSIKYRYNRKDAPGTVNGDGAVRAWTNLDGGVDLEDSTTTAAFGSAAAVTQTGGRIRGYNSGGLAATRNDRRNTTGQYIDAGEFNAIAVDSNGCPVIVYYDKTNEKLRLAMSNNIAPVNATYWLVQDIFPAVDNTATGAVDQNRKGTGEYVSMVIDTQVTPNRVHIAAMNRAAMNLVYITGTIANRAWTFEKAQVVDSVGTVGSWCEISMDSDGNPWIAYHDEGYTGSRDGVKIAYYNANRYYKGSTYTGAKYIGEDVDANNVRIEGWEAMHIPTAYRVESARVGMECYPVRNFTPRPAQKFWNGAVGYLGQDFYRIAYYVR